MSASKAVFVLIHGGWHNRSAWDRVTPILKAGGFAALTLDLPGAGVNAIEPTSLSQPAALSKILIDICVQSLAAQRRSMVGLDT